MLGIRLEKTIDMRLTHLAKKTGRTKSYYAKLAIQEFLDDREDYLLGLAALERKETAISLDELIHQLGLKNDYKNKKNRHGK